MSILHDACSTILHGLSRERQDAIRRVAEQLVRIRLPTETIDALLGALILEAAEVEVSESVGVTPSYQSTLEVLREVFDRPKLKKPTN